MSSNLFKLSIACVLFMPMLAYAQSGANALKLHLNVDRTSVDLHANLKITMCLSNEGDQPITVYGQLLRGYAGGIVLHVKDDAGKEVAPRSLDDDLVPPPSPREKGRFLTLFPGHFWGKTEALSIAELVDKPGRYHLTISYQSPLPKSLGSAPNFWGRENSPLLSEELILTVQ